MGEITKSVPPIVGLDAASLTHAVTASRRRWDDICATLQTRNPVRGLRAEEIEESLGVVMEERAWLMRLERAVSQSWEGVHLPEAPMPEIRERAEVVALRAGA